MASETFAEDILNVRRRSPLVHNITNYVAMNFSANALLAIGASPLMSSEPEEMAEISAVSSALVINTGCLERIQIEAMTAAADSAHSSGKPWVLDPAGAGISRIRNSAIRNLISSCRPTLIRGNASEIMFLAGADSTPKGMDSVDDSKAAVEYAVRLARASGSVVAVSGQEDFVTDGRMIVGILNGSPVMAKVTAMGCTASAVAGAFLAVDGNALEATANAMALMGVAGETAASASAGPGSFVPEFLDALANLTPEEVSESMRYEEFTA